jgi:hypothetical protein
VYETNGDGGSYVAAAAEEGTPDSFHGTISATETLTLDVGTFDTWLLEYEEGDSTMRMWWADGVGWVRQGDDETAYADLVDYGPR